MAIVYPRAGYFQLAGKSRTLLVPRIIDIHTMVGTLLGTQAYFSTAGNPYSHFGTSGAGEVRQWQDLTFRAASDLDGNPISISIENEDKGSYFPAWTGTNVPRFTPAQAEAIAQLVAWLCARFAIPPVVIPNTLPSNAYGACYHRLGVDPYRVFGGIRLSAVYAKACPGDRRIPQVIDEIMPRVRRLLGMNPPPPPPPPPLEESNDMYLLFHPEPSWWQIGPGKVAIQISGNAFDRMKKTSATDLNGLPSFALNAEDCDAIINALNGPPEVPVDADPNS
jgi:N-acetylmuramoyl-L-alanine amidase